jgi:predicted phosphoribosyltransferase
VLGLPRGGVPVAAEVASALHAPLDVWIVRKLGVPGHEEYAMGAIASGGVIDLDRERIAELRIRMADVEDVVRKEASELGRRERAYRRGRSPPDVRGKTIILVDDGLATGSTMRAAVSALRQLAPARIVVGVPVAAEEACADLGDRADACVCVSRPDPFYAVGAWYEDFRPTTDDEVIACLERFGDGRAERAQGSAARGAVKP